MNFSTAKKILISTIFVISSGNASAGTVVPKPGIPDGFASEFGSALAAHGSYTLVGASQETVQIPGEPIFAGNPVGGQGAIYLFNGTSSTPERIYQFAGNDHFFKRAGLKVSMSDKWLAFSAEESALTPSEKSKVYIVGKTSGAWPTCPSTSGVLDCTTLVKANGAAGSQPIIAIEYPERLNGTDMILKISDDYLVMGNSRKSQVFIYKHNSVTGVWQQEFALDDLDERHVGTAVAIDGDLIAVSAPTTDGFVTSPEYGSVRVLKRDASGTWNTTGNVIGWFTTGNFGRSLDMHQGNLIVGSGYSGGTHHVNFFSVNSSGAIAGAQTIELEDEHRHLAIDGSAAIVTNFASDERLKVFTRDAVSGVWSQSSAMNGDRYISPSTNLAYAGSDQIDLVGDRVVLGWRGYDRNNGAVLFESLSDIDKCKSQYNLVGNCSFDAGNSGWQYLNHVGASSWGNFSGGELRSTIYWGSNVHWHIQARASVVLPTSGSYRLRFRAKADSARNITVNLGHNGDIDNIWVSYAQTTFTLTSQYQEFEHIFTGVPADANAYLDFNLGDQGSVPVNLDGISLEAL